MRSLQGAAASPLLVAISLTVLAVLALFSVAESRSNRAERDAAARDVQSCRELAAEITALRELPQFAALEAESPQSIADRIEQATAETQLPAEALLRIQPQSSSRLGRTPYRVTPTRVELRQVTLQQAITFGAALADESRGLTIRDLRLWTTASNEAESVEETWSVEITLTHLTYSGTSS